MIGTIKEFALTSNNLVYLEYFLRIFIACVCGLFIGLERSKRQKEAGIRTHIILAMGCALMTIVSKYGFEDLLSKNPNGADGSRVAANIITGIGFLGAGVIFVRGGSVRGLTTAAGIWTTAGIGIAIGSGLYSIGIGTTILLMFVQIFIHKMFPSLETTFTIELYVKAKIGTNMTEKLNEYFNTHNIIINSFKIRKNQEDEEVRFNIRAFKNATIEQILLFINSLDGVIEFNTMQ